jgi:hypothetical protein
MRVAEAIRLARAHYSSETGKRRFTSECVALQIWELQGDFGKMQGGPKAYPCQKRPNLNRLGGVSLLQEQGGYNF